MISSTVLSTLLLAFSLSAVNASPVGGVEERAPATGVKSVNAARYWGSCIDQQYLSDATYKSVATQQVNAATAENECKWDSIEASQNSFNFAGCDAVQGFAASVGKFRLHNMVWYSQLPGWVSSLQTSAVQAAMQNHIAKVMGHYKGLAYAVDVVNEPFNDDGSYRTGNPFYNAMGTNYIPIAMGYARTADPNAKLYVNDYNIEAAGSKSNAMYTLASSLKAQNLIDGVGFESHFIVGQIPTTLQSNMQRFSALGIQVAITELDIRMPTPASSANLAQQATDYATVVKACKAVSTCPGVTAWGFTDKYSWIPSTFSGQGAALYLDASYNAKPAYNSLITNWADSSSPAPGGGGTTTTTTTTTTLPPTTTTTTTTPPPTSTPPSTACSAKYGQCGGQGWTGATCCQAGSTCKYSNAYYSQCL